MGRFKLILNLIFFSAVVSASEPSVCKTEECVALSQAILRNMDDTVNPCDDFYKFACGGFMKSVESENKSVSVSNNMYKRMTHRIRTTLNGLEADSPRPFRLLRSYIQSCENQGEKDQNCSPII